MNTITKKKCTLNRLLWFAGLGTKSLSDCSPPGSSVHGIFQTSILEWVSVSFSRGSSWSRDQTQVSCTAGRFFTDWSTKEAPTDYCFQPVYARRGDMWFPCCPKERCLSQVGYLGNSAVFLRRYNKYKIWGLRAGWLGWYPGSVPSLLCRLEFTAYTLYAIVAYSAL